MDSVIITTSTIIPIITTKNNANRNSNHQHVILIYQAPFLASLYNIWLQRINLPKSTQNQECKQTGIHPTQIDDQAWTFRLLQRKPDSTVHTWIKQGVKPERQYPRPSHSFSIICFSSNRDRKVNKQATKRLGMWNNTLPKCLYARNCPKSMHCAVIPGHPGWLTSLQKVQQILGTHSGSCCLRLMAASSFSTCSHSSSLVHIRPSRTGATVSCQHTILAYGEDSRLKS